MPGLVAFWAALVGHDLHALPVGNSVGHFLIGVVQTSIGISLIVPMLKDMEKELLHFFGL